MNDAQVHQLVEAAHAAQVALNDCRRLVSRAELGLQDARIDLAAAHKVWLARVQAIGDAIVGDLAALAGLLANSGEESAAESVIGKPAETLNSESASATDGGPADDGAGGGVDARADGSASVGADGGDIAPAGEVDNLAAALAQTDPALQAVAPERPPAAARRVVYEAGYAPPPAPAVDTGPDRLAKAAAGIERELAAATPHTPALPDFDPGALPATKRVHAWLTKHTGSQAVAAIAAGTKLPNMAVSRVLNSLQEQGLVTRIGRGHWARTVK